jgi:hypothetical protein
MHASVALPQITFMDQTVYAGLKKPVALVAHQTANFNVENASALKRSGQPWGGYQCFCFLKRHPAGLGAGLRVCVGSAICNHFVA